MTAEVEYGKLVHTYVGQPEVVAGQMFGKPCIKVSGKAFVSQHKDTVIFKLTGDHHKNALAIKGAALWDPSGKGRPMREWVALPAEAKSKFVALAQAAYDYVRQA